MHIGLEWNILPLNPHSSDDFFSILQFQVKLSSSLASAPLLLYLTSSLLVVGLVVCMTSCVGWWAGVQGVRGGVVMVRGGIGESMRNDGLS